MEDFNNQENYIKTNELCKSMFLPTEINKKNILFSVHHKEKEKTLWYKSYWESMKYNIIKEDIVYHHSNNHHFLHNSILSLTLPNLIVKKNYKIKWCDNLFLNILKNYKVLFNDKELQHGNDKSLFFEFNCKNNWDTVSDNLGNKKNLTTYSNELYSDTIFISIPWFYSKDKSDSFPLHILSKNQILKHIFSFDLKLENLLIIIDEDGNSIPFDKDLFVSDINDLNIPDLDALYTNITNKELEVSKSNKFTYEFFSDSYLYKESDEINLGEKINFNIEEDLNVTEIFWGCQNLQENNSLYFGTNENKSPVKETSFLDIMKNTMSFKTDKVFLYHLLEKVPDKIGMNYWKNSILKKEDGRKFSPTINIKNSNFEIKLIDKYNNENNQQFKGFVLFKYVQKFIFNISGNNITLQKLI